MQGGRFIDSSVDSSRNLVIVELIKERLEINEVTTKYEVSFSYNQCCMPSCLMASISMPNSMKTNLSKVVDTIIRFITLLDLVGIG